MKQYKNTQKQINNNEIPSRQTKTPQNHKLCLLVMRVILPLTPQTPL